MLYIHLCDLSFLSGTRVSCSSWLSGVAVVQPGKVTLHFGEVRVGRGPSGIVFHLTLVSMVTGRRIKVHCVVVTYPIVVTTYFVRCLDVVVPPVIVVVCVVVVQVVVVVGCLVRRWRVPPRRLNTVSVMSSSSRLLILLLLF